MSDENSSRRLLIVILMSKLSWKQWASDGIESEVGFRPENWVKHASLEGTKMQTYIM